MDYPIQNQEPMECLEEDIEEEKKSGLSIIMEQDDEEESPEPLKQQELDEVV